MDTFSIRMISAHNEASALALRRALGNEFPGSSRFASLFTRALERDLKPGITPRDEEHFVIDEDGWPVLKREQGSRVVVTSEFVRELMEKEGI